nr:DUF739 family protein [uncultured Lachnoclostridium sp.]
MVVNVPKLKGKIIEKGTTQESVADSMGMCRSTFYRKMKNGGAGFTIGEIHKLVKVLMLSKEEAIDIFFNQQVA